MSCKKKERPNLGLQAGPDMKDRKTVCGIGDARARSHASPKLCCSISARTQLLLCFVHLQMSPELVTKRLMLNI